jgi:hypothetical protein
LVKIRIHIELTYITHLSEAPHSGLPQPNALRDIPPISKWEEFLDECIHEAAGFMLGRYESHIWDISVLILSKDGLVLADIDGTGGVTIIREFWHAALQNNLQISSLMWIFT